MAKRYIFLTLSCVTNLVLVAAVMLTVYGALWEYSTRSYLRGFSDAVVPYAAAPQQKVEVILAWMSGGPVRRFSDPSGDFAVTERDPGKTLNYGRLLQDCGTATNAFVNLADSSGLEARRLLLIGPDGTATHVVAEVRLDDRWIVVDPLFHTLLKDPAGHLLARVDLADPATSREATRKIAGYHSDYSYANTQHLRLAGIPWIGGLVQKSLDFAYPEWKASLDWTLLRDRKSYAVLVAGILLLSLSLVGRLWLTWSWKKRLGPASAPLLTQAGDIALRSLGDPWHPARNNRI